MPPAIIAAAIAVGASAAAAAGIIAVTTAMVIAVGATLAASLLFKPSVPSIGGYTSQQERKQVLRSATAPMVFVYGTTVISGLLFFAEEEAGTSEKEWVHLAIALTGHPIERVSRIWLGDDLIDTYGEYASFEIHNNRQTVDPFMKAKCKSWKDDMIGKGICWARISLKFNQDKFPAGIPNIKFEIFGKKVFDPRTGNTAWSNNAALCILDYYRSYLKIPNSDISMEQFTQAANISDELVATHQRYRINGSFDTGETQAGVLDDLHLACAGEPTYMAGKHGLLVGAYYGPANMDITEGQIISDVKIIPEAAFGDKVNIVTGTFLDPNQQYTEIDYPPVKVDQYITEDGGEYTADLKLRFVSNEYQAQQLAQIKINRTRIGRIFSFTMNMSGYQYRPGYYVNLYLPQLGVNGQEFRITEWDMSAQNGVAVVLKQETSQVWLDIVGKPIERPDITDFPSAGMPQPINLLYTVTEIGEVVQGILSWSNVGAFSYNIVNVRQNGQLVQSIQVPGPGQLVQITGLLRGQYDIGVMAVSQLGVRSNETFTQIVINAPDAPVSCLVDQGYFEITLKPKLAQITNVSTQFDFWTSGEDKLNDTLESTVTTQATRAGIGQLWTSSGLQVDHTYYWYIRSINAFGSSGFLEVAALCDSNIAGIGDIIDKAIKDSNAFQALDEPVRVSLENSLNTAMANNANVKAQYAQLGPIKASVVTISTTVADLDKSVASLETIVETEFEDMKSTVATVAQSVSDLESSTASFEQQVNSQFNNVNAAVSTKMTSMVHDDGSASATWAMNLGVTRDNVYYGAGLALAIEPDGSSYKSTAVFRSQQFGIYSGSDPGSYKLAFAVFNGQVYIDDAMIRDASIKNAKIEDAAITRAKISTTLSSDNYVQNQTGMRINFATGLIEMNGTIAGQGRLVITNTRIVAYDTSGNPVAVMGQRI